MWRWPAGFFRPGQGMGIGASLPNPATEPKRNQRLKRPHPIHTTPSATCFMEILQRPKGRLAALHLGQRSMTDILPRPSCHAVLEALTAPPRILGRSLMEIELFTGPIWHHTLATYEYIRLVGNSFPAGMDCFLFLWQCPGKRIIRRSRSCQNASTNGKSG